MVIARSIEEYRNIQQKRINILKRGVRRGPITAAKYMAARMRILAPRDSGRMIRTIHRRRNSVEVGGVSPTGFPYVHWVNATPGSGLERINLPQRFRPSRLRGNSGLISYAQVAKTGTPGFFWIAQDDTRKMFREAMLRNTRNALIANF